MFHPRLRPGHHRGAFAYFDVPAGVLVAGGAVYHPPASGAVIEWANASPDGAGAAGDYWRFAVLDQATFAGVTFGDLGAPTVVPIWPGGAYDPSGVFRQGQFFGLGDRFPMAQRRPMETEILVIPPNVFVVALVTDNVVAEGGFIVHEFLNPDEFERWNVGNGERSGR